ncbi:hypothetical protein FQR65_LT12584 [Abscondita terminalis]|nr:hypothetical protein FQR65_LT12584 [Abscondita terminalis]
MEDDSKKLDAVAVDNFRKYLRIPSVHPDVNYDDCVNFLRGVAEDLQLSFNVYECHPRKPMVVISWIGKEPKLPSVMLNSHMDVVPVIEDDWVFKPFDAVMDQNGDIYGRGAQDVKSLGIQYLEAIRRLKLKRYQPRRSVHVSFAPDEEIGGLLGMKLFAKSEYFKKLGVGFALDEGIPGQTEYWVYYAEKISKSLIVHCKGQGGHGSLMIDNTPGEKLARLLKKIYEFRANEKEKGDEAVTVNLTIMQGGVQNNVIPDEFLITLDTRLPPTVDLEHFVNIVKRWCKDAGEDVWVENLDFEELPQITKLDESNPFWLGFKDAVEKMNIPLKTLVLHASSDARYLRAAGVPTLGFCPHLNTPIRAHRDNEFMNVDVFLHGIGAYCKIIPAIADV